MRWKGRRSSSNVEDRRGASRSGSSFRLPMRVGRGSGRAGGGLGIGGIVVLVAIAWMVGINPLDLLMGLDQDNSTVSTRSVPSSGSSSQADQELAQFVSVVLADTEDTWSQIQSQRGETYPEPSLVLFNDAVQSACGQASAAVGPFYCGQDQKIYIDLSFYRQLAGQLGAPGDFAQAYVLAHEVGHHMQNVLGILPQYYKARQGMSERDANALSVRIELQADCFAGIWAHYAASQENFVEEGDIDEALNAASRIGDDTLQKRAKGYAVPETFNHGSSAQRQRWFKAGFKSGQLRSCNTLSTDSL